MNLVQSYKLRKSSETVLFPIENELKLLRQENDRSWLSLTSKILSVAISGIGTTMLCQDNLLPAYIKQIFSTALGEENPLLLPPWISILQLLAAVTLFSFLSFVSIKIINWKNETKDNKKTGSAIENLAEVFHKIILNNVITGISFTKKAEEKFEILERLLKEYCNAPDESKENQIKEIKREFCLYLSEAVYYFTIADGQMRENCIIEIGNRDEYLEYLEKVGILTLTETLFMFEKSISKLKLLFTNMKKANFSIWKENENEMLSINNCLKKLNDMMKNILLWKSNLSDTVKNNEKYFQ